jgi:hypothetical protein
LSQVQQTSSQPPQQQTQQVEQPKTPSFPFGSSFDNSGKY